jgi:nascent polypeptide-associated complex subunit beta
MPFDPAKLAKLVGKSENAVRTGGKGTVRRKKAVVHKATAADDKKLKSTLQKLGARDIPAIEEVNLFHKDGHVIHFVNPKVQASIAANTYVVSGPSESKKLEELLPGIITQLGPDNLNDLKKIYAQFAQGAAKGQAAAGKDDEDDVPDLIDTNFEDGPCTAITLRTTSLEKPLDERWRLATEADVNSLFVCSLQSRTRLRPRLRRSKHLVTPPSRVLIAFPRARRSPHPRSRVRQKLRGEALLPSSCAGKLESEEMITSECPPTFNQRRTTRTAGGGVDRILVGCRHLRFDLSHAGRGFVKH